jgi:iron-sulfur cluster assembly protein
MACVILSEKAVKEIKRLMADQDMKPDSTYVRAGVRGGGCSGFQYSFNLDENVDENKDVIEEQDGLKIVVDKRSMMYIQGTMIDYHDQLEKRGFSFNNPNASGKCGCGSSFNV